MSNYNLDELLGNAYATREAKKPVTLILNYWETLVTGLKTEVIEFPTVEKGLEYLDTLRARGITLNKCNYGFYRFGANGAVEVFE